MKFQINAIVDDTDCDGNTDAKDYIKYLELLFRDDGISIVLLEVTKLEELNENPNSGTHS